mgnify:CR=1 FL=1
MTGYSVLILNFFLRLNIKADFDMTSCFGSSSGLNPNNESYFFSLGLGLAAGLFFYCNFGN